MGRRRQAAAARAKSSKAANARGSDRKRLDRAFRSLGLIDSEQPAEQWFAELEARVGIDVVEEWFGEPTGGLAEEYDFNYESFDRAIFKSVSWRSQPLRVECEWMLPRLREALDRCASEAPFLVELGAGPGAASALFSAALKVPVLALDSHPKSLGLPEQFAERTGGSVESVVADAVDLAAVLGSRKPAAVFSMSAFRYILGHDHVEAGFSNLESMYSTLREFEVPSPIGHLIDALAGADLLTSEVGCADFIAEVTAVMRSRDYFIPDGGIRRAANMHTPGDVQQTTLVHYTQFAGYEQCGSDLLYEMHRPLPSLHAGMSISSDTLAEVVRRDLKDVDFIWASEIVYADGSGVMRSEMFSWNGLLGWYQATTRGFRFLAFHNAHRADELIEGFEAEQARLVSSGLASVAPISVPSNLWTT